MERSPIDEAMGSVEQSEGKIHEALNDCNMEELVAWALAHENNIQVARATIKDRYRGHNYSVVLSGKEALKSAGIEDFTQADYNRYMKKISDSERKLGEIVGDLSRRCPSMCPIHG